MRYRLLLPAVALSALALPVSGASAATAYPSISKVSPLTLGVGDTLTITGRNFRAGKDKTTVVFQRSGGRAVFVKAAKATTTKLTLVVPAKLLTSMRQKSGAPVATTFRVRVLADRFGKRFTTLKASPRIGPVATGGGKTSSSDCDGDTIPNATDPDDDNDLLSDAVEREIGTDTCKRDTDGDGMSDGWEQESAIDYNGSSVPSPKKRPYPNALNKEDGAIDSDGDGLTNILEYEAWATYGNNSFPLNYSGGNPATGGKKAPGEFQTWWDRDGNGFLTDNERDADGDGIPNQDEGGVGPLPYIVDKLGFFAPEYIEDPKVRAIVDVVPLFGELKYTHKVDSTNWLDLDSDGDGLNDGADDQDGDGIPNLDEVIVDVTQPDGTQHAINACVPNLDSRMCTVGDDDIDNDGLTNRNDDDDDGDLLPDTLERQLGLNPFKADSDGDGITDGYEYQSAKDLNEQNHEGSTPYPYKRPYPNPLDGKDADTDFDGDGLTLTAEYKAWRYAGSPSPLNYSDGTQRTLQTQLRDDQKDVDGDGLDNYTEFAGPLSSSAWWDGYVAQKAVKCNEAYKESPYPLVTYAGTSFVDPDSDGDGILDGPDDLDHDGYTNIQEAFRPADWCQTYVSLNGNAHPKNTNPGGTTNADARVQPFNPCKPRNSNVCHVHPPQGYYPPEEDWLGADPGPYTPPAGP